MALIGILFVLTLAGGVLSHLFLSISSSTQLMKSVFIEAQQFQAAEAGLRHGEKQLIKIVSTKSNLELSSIQFNNYLVTLEVIKLPQKFCILPKKNIGHYYQLTASSVPIKQVSPSSIQLQSTIALIDSNENCTPKLIKRFEGCSSWCQVT